ncbi:MAG: hypothetical protein RBJ76_08225 [Stenomitos frigidus ULC029]
MGSDSYDCLATGLPADFVVLNFHQPHLRSSQHTLASIVTRVPPEVVLLTVRQGIILWQAENSTISPFSGGC